MIGTSYIIIACYPDKGMKSYGNKSLIDFHKKKLLQYQIDSINLNKDKNKEIIVISDFETHKIQKCFSDQIIIKPLNETNPIYYGCDISIYDHVIFIDYGCIFKHNLLKKLRDKSTVAYASNADKYKSDIGCIIENNKLKHMFFDLPENRYCNIFTLCKTDKLKILQNQIFSYFNLLSFEIINMLMESGSEFTAYDIKSEDFIYFNHMRQKNAVAKFIKKYY